METINGYQLTSQFSTDHSGFSRWAFGQKDGIEVFIKEFLSPVYPVNTELFTTEAYQQRCLYCERFVAEKQKLYSTLLRCNNIGIVPVLDFFRDNAKYYIVTEKIDAAPLSVEDVFILLPSQKLQMLTALGEAFENLHKNGIIHADIKPENILWQQLPNGWYLPKIIDFDSSFLIGSAVSVEEIEGDFLYLAPETFFAMKNQPCAITPQLDIFALGILFYQYLLGTLPAFGNFSGTYTYEAILQECPLSFPPGTNKHTVTLLTTMLNLRPEKRPDMKKILKLLKKSLK